MGYVGRLASPLSEVRIPATVDPINLVNGVTAMSHSKSARQYDKARAIVDATEKAERDAKREAAKLYAGRVIRAFNACVGRGRAPAFFPTIRCCVVAEQTRLETTCPGCGMITHSHVDKSDFHEMATVAMLLFKIRCSRCREEAPLARIRCINSWSDGVPKLNLERWGAAAAGYK